MRKNEWPTYCFNRANNQLQGGIMQNGVFFKNAQHMDEIAAATVDLIITSPPYFNVKDYAKDGFQKSSHSERNNYQLGHIQNYATFIREILKVWIECERILKPNGKLAINVPLLPMKKKDMDTHHNRHIFDLNADIQHSILTRPGTKMYLYDLYIWRRTNASKKLMFGSYPYPRNFYAQNFCEFISVYVKDGQPSRDISPQVKEQSKLSEAEWVEYTKQIWDIAIPHKGDIAFGKHAAIMPEEIARRCIKLFTFVDDVVLDPFAGSGTTLKVAKELGRRYIGYEIERAYEPIISAKLGQAQRSNPYADLLEAS